MTRIAFAPGRSRPVPAVVLLSLAAACAPGAVASAQQSPGVVGTLPAAEVVLDSITGTRPLSRAHWGVIVLDAATGSTLLERNADQLFIPASNMKLVTAAAAMDRLGPDYRFATTLEADLRADGTADSLVVLGGGDPTLRTPFHDPPLAPLDSLADSLAAAGLRRVDGPLIVDQRLFDSTLVHPAWETFDLDWYYAAPIAPFAITAGAVELVVTPAPPGKDARVHLPWVQGIVGVDARVRTTAGGNRWNDALRRIPPDSLVLRGSIGVGAGPDTSWVAQVDPGLVAGRALRAALERAGIAVVGPVRVRNGAGSPGAAAGRVAGAADRGAAGPGSVRVVWRSPPLEEIIPVVLERSDNWIAEQLVKTLGADASGTGSWSSGSEALERFLLERVGADPGSSYIRDGSGLTAQNLLTPRALAQLLRFVREQPWADAFRRAMVQPGEREGTLEERLTSVEDRLWAKTGTIRHVNALSGFALPVDGRELIFSILTNGSGRPSSEVRSAIDRIVRILIEHGS